jgi:hypothetical protein
VRDPRLRKVHSFFFFWACATRVSARCIHFFFLDVRDPRLRKVQDYAAATRF